MFRRKVKRKSSSLHKKRSVQTIIRKKSYSQNSLNRPSSSSLFTSFANQIEIRTPLDLFQGDDPSHVSTLTWLHKSTNLIEQDYHFSVILIGEKPTEIDSNEAIYKLSASYQRSNKSQSPVTITLNMQQMRIGQGGKTLATHSMKDIIRIVQDPYESKYFGVTVRDKNSRLKSIIFKGIEEKNSNDVCITLAQFFELSYQIENWSKYNE